MELTQADFDRMISFYVTIVVLSNVITIAQIIYKTLTDILL